MAAKGFVRNFKPLDVLTEEQVEQTMREAVENRPKVKVMIQLFSESIAA